jgi:hypothetical protein
MRRLVFSLALFAALVSADQCIDPQKAVGDCCLTSSGTTSCGSVSPALVHLDAEEIAARERVVAPRRRHPPHLARFFEVMREHAEVLEELARARGSLFSCKTPPVGGTPFKPYNMGFALQANDGPKDAIKLTLTPDDSNHPIDLKDQNLSDTTSIAGAYTLRQDYTLLTGECLSFILFGGNVTTDSALAQVFRVEPVSRSTSIAGNGPRVLTNFYPTDCVTPASAPFQLCAKQGTLPGEALFALLGPTGNIIFLVPLQYPNVVSVGPITPSFYAENPFAYWTVTFAVKLFINPSTNQLNAGAADVGWSHNPRNVPIIIKQLVISNLE